ncbi:hypothetical protein [Virgibacillus kimchii]
MSDKKRVIITVGNVRIKEYDSMNVTVERYEDVFIPTLKRKDKRWAFKAYQSNLLSAMLYIHRNELLIDKDKITDLNTHLEQVKKSNAELLEAVRE